VKRNPVSSGPSYYGSLYVRSPPSSGDSPGAALFAWPGASQPISCGRRIDPSFCLALHKPRPYRVSCRLRRSPWLRCFPRTLCSCLFSWPPQFHAAVFMLVPVKWWLESSLFRTVSLGIIASLAECLSFLQTTYSHLNCSP
jgi:hypothetical protein